MSLSSALHLGAFLFPTLDQIQDFLKLLSIDLDINIIKELRNLGKKELRVKKELPRKWDLFKKKVELRRVIALSLSLDFQIHGK